MPSHEPTHAPCHRSTLAHSHLYGLRKRVIASLSFLMLLLGSAGSEAADLTASVIHGQRIDLSWDLSELSVTELALTRCADARCTSLPLSAGATGAQDPGARPGTAYRGQTWPRGSGSGASYTDGRNRRGPSRRQDR